MVRLSGIIVCAGATLLVGFSPVLASFGGENTTVFLIFPFLEHWLHNHESVAIISSTWTIMVLMTLFFYLSTRTLRTVPGVLQGLAEGIVEGLTNFLAEQLDSRRAEQNLSFVLALALFIFFGNFFGLIPGLEGTTANFSTTLSLGLLVFVYYNFRGIQEMGIIKHVAHFFGPKLPWFLKPVNLMLFPIELISHIVRPLSLALRLAGNMTGGHAVVGIFYGLLAVPFLYPVAIYGLEFIAAIVQTFIFVLLTAIYVKLATEHSEGEEH